MQYGTKVNGRLEPRFIETADLTDAGKVYQVDIETSGIVDEASAIEQLLTLEQQFPDLQIVYIETNRNTNMIQLQFVDAGPGQFSFTGLLGAMPMLLGVVFIGVVAFVLWQVYSTNPILLWALLALGAGVAFFFFTSGKITAPTKAIFGERERHPPSPTAQFEQARSDIRQAQRIAQKDVEAIEKKIAAAKEDLKREEKKVKKKQKEKPQSVVLLEEQIKALEKQESLAKDERDSLR